jgi:dethiobiotin synthetase
MNRGLFITGTDTGVGKTVLTGAIAAVLRERGVKVGVMKPVATGCVARREGLVSEDGEFLAQVADVAGPLDEITPIRLAEPLAPTVAAARAGAPIDLERVWQAWRRLRAAHDVMLVEGIGGILCPITPDRLLADVAKEFGLPVLIVARANLGTINHTLLTVEAARARGLAIAGIVLNRYHTDSTDLAEFTNPDEIARASGAAILGLVPDDPTTNFAHAVVGEEVLDAVRLMPLGPVLGF